TRGKQLVTSDTAGIGHKPLVSTTTTTRQHDGRARQAPQSPQPSAAATPMERLVTSDISPTPGERLVTSDPAPIPAERLVTRGKQLVTSDTAGIGHKPLVSTTITTTWQLDAGLTVTRPAPPRAPVEGLVTRDPAPSPAEVPDLVKPENTPPPPRSCHGCARQGPQPARTSDRDSVARTFLVAKCSATNDRNGTVPASMIARNHFSDH
ncbi:hypothetical protein SAMN02745244_03668, partial [Tessaracoccus bendigoensis DSM 12906]